MISNRVYPGSFSDVNAQLAQNALLSVKPRSITNIDDFTVDNSMYQEAADSVDSSASLNTTTRELTITVGGSGFLYSGQAHKTLTYGRNIIMNTVFKAATLYPQVYMRLNAKDHNGAIICYLDNITLHVSRINNGVMSEIAYGAVDGANNIDMEISTRTFGTLYEIIARQGGKVIGSMRLLDTAFGALPGIANGLGASGATVYKNYLKAAELYEYINIICLGDSNTYGHNLTTKQTYPSQLQNRYFESNVGVVNKGVSSNLIADVVARLANDVYANKVTGARNVVVLQIGTNDASGGTNGATIYSNISGLVSTLKANGLEVWLSTIPPRTDHAPTLVQIKAANTLILADANADRVIDLYTLLVDTTDAVITGLLQADGIHLTEQGTLLFASLVANQLGQ